MDKNAIKKYAVWARRELIERVSQRALVYGISAKDAGDPNVESVNGHLLSQAEKRQRQALIRNIKTKGYEQVVEEVAYTWFNRFAALRFMEVNGYLPSHIRVFTNDAGEFKPQILAEAIHLELDGLDMNKVYELESANKSEELFKYLLIVQCNALNSILPGMFQRIEDYTELLLPDYLLREGSMIEQMVTTIPEADWLDQVEIIGWLYQYYNIETFDSIFDGDMSRNKVTKDLLPAATEIFTPDWAVRFMVDNSLGRLWIDNHVSDHLKAQCKYYLEEAPQDSQISSQLDIAKAQYAGLRPEEILCVDPCMGSGHILCYMFDVLIRIYEDYGYSAREAAPTIISKNLWGLDIDERAAQLAYFSLMMKARQYDRRIFSRSVTPHVFAIVESDTIEEKSIQRLRMDLPYETRQQNIGQLLILIEKMKNAKEHGSLISMLNMDWTSLRHFCSPVEESQITLDLYGDQEVLNQLNALIDVAEALSNKYHVAVTNPPYLGNSRMNASLGDFIKGNYPDEKADLAMAMINRLTWGFTAPNGYAAAITTVSWMYLRSFEAFRRKMIDQSNFVCLVDYGTELFEGKIGHLPIASWVCRNVKIEENIHSVRLVDYCYSRRDEKEPEFFNRRNRYFSNQSDFSKIPGAPIAYWASQKKIEAFERGILIDSIASVKIGMGTGKNAVFVRNWWETPFSEIDFSLKSIDELNRSPGTFFPYNKGGDFRRWYGNLQEVVWFNAAGRKRMFSMSGHRENGGKDGYFKQGITWNFIGTSKFGVRLMPYGCLFDVAGSALFTESSDIYYILGFLSSTVCNEILKLLNPTVNYQAGNVKSLPVLFERKDEVDEIVKGCIETSKMDWDSFETSWGFKEHPFITSAYIASRNGEAVTIKQAFEDWKSVADDRFHKLKDSENKLNSLFIEIYGLGEELTPEVEDKDVTVRKADLQREVRSFISYAVGCMFGRYTLGESGLIYAGGEWDGSKYSQFVPDKDAIIPICDDEYFEDDIVGRFVSFIEKTFGKKVLEENLRFIADVLGGKGSSREIIRNYFINDFYADHLKTYQKCPIYWLFDSGKKNGFKCLIYMHRYQPDTIARIRTDYVHEQQSRYRTAIADLEQRINGASTSERVKLNKQLTKLRAQAEETRVYEEKIHHLADQMVKIDLDDGVKHNYAIFKDVLAKIK